VDFAELNSYNIGGLSAAILRCVHSDSIRYIFSATGKGRRRLREVQSHALHYTKYIFIQSDEDVRTWLLLNQPNKDPLVILIYSHRPATQTRPPIPPEPRHQSLAPDAVSNWANAAAGRNVNRRRQPNTKANPTSGTKASGSQNLQDPPLSLRE